MSYIDEMGLATKRANLGVVATGELIAAVAGKAIQVLALHVQCGVASDVTLIFQDDTGTPVQLMGVTAAPLYMSDDGTTGPRSITLPFNERGWFQTSVGQALDVAVTGTTPDISVSIVYVEI